MKYPNCFGVSYKVYDGGVIFEGTFDGKINGQEHILVDQALILALKENLNVILKRQSS